MAHTPPNDSQLHKSKPKVVLVSVQLPGVSDREQKSSLDELERLCSTLGFITLARISQKRRSIATGTILGEGKLKEMAHWTGGEGVVNRFQKNIRNHVNNVHEETAEEAAYRLHDQNMMMEEENDPNGLDGLAAPKELATLVVVDCEITPTQLRNLEEASGVEVLDRSGVILEIFSRHARSREARLQVEIAKLAYMAPRLRASHVGGDRQGGGIGAKGAGESAHELDRRRIRDRIAELRRQLESIRHEQTTRRSQRQEALCVALVGYTNAGKSSLMRALTASDVLVENKLFATLDTTVRALQPESVPRILISDTVGFIKKLPHDLVASFRSTLDEALSASLLLYTVDASDPDFRSQLDVTKTVLADIGATDGESRLILNKIDQLNPEELNKLKLEYPEALFISTRNQADIAMIRNMILGFFEKGMIDKTVLVPYPKGQVLGVIREKARVVSEKHEAEGTLVTLRALPEIHEWIQKQLVQDPR